MKTLLFSLIFILTLQGCSHFQDWFDHLTEISEQK